MWGLFVITDLHRRRPQFWTKSKGPENNRKTLKVIFSPEMAKSRLRIGTFWQPRCVLWFPRLLTSWGKSLLWWLTKRVFLSSCHLTWISRRGANEGWNGPAGGKTGGESDTLVSPESVFPHIRLTSIDRERRGERGARGDQRMTGEREEESQPKQRLLLKFPCTGFHACWERRKDVVSTPEPTPIQE